MIYLEDAFMDHPKMVAAGDEGILMWLRGVQWLKEQRSSDGRIPKVVVHRCCGPVVKGRPLPTEQIMRRLIEVGSWHDDGDCIVVHGYTERNEASIRRSEAGRKNAEKRWRKDATADAMASLPDANGSASTNAVADAYSPQSTVHVETPSLPHLFVAPGPEEPPGMEQVDALLRKRCPPGKERLFGNPRADLIRALERGGNLTLALAALRQGDPSEGAVVRTQRALTALGDGKLGGSEGGMPLNEKGAERARRIVTEPAAPPEATQDGLAHCRLALRRQA